MKSNRKKRIIAAVLCMVMVLCSNISALAGEELFTDTPVTVEEMSSEPAAESDAEPEVTATVAPTPMALSNLEDTSVDGGSSDTAPETMTGSTTEPVTESTTESTGETTNPLIPEGMDTVETTGSTTE